MLINYKIISFIINNITNLKSILVIYREYLIYLWMSFKSLDNERNKFSQLQLDVVTQNFNYCEMMTIIVYEFFLSIFSNI